MKDMTKQSYSAAALAAAGLMAFAACSLQPTQAKSGGSTQGGSATSSGGQGGTSGGGQGGNSASGASNSAGGSPTGGDTSTNGSSAGGNPTGGGTSGGNPAGGSVTGGSVTGGAPTGGSVSGGAPTGGSVTGGTTTAGGSRTGGATTGGATTGGSPIGGTTTSGSRTGGTTTGGTTTGGTTTGGTSAGGTTTGGTSASSSVPTGNVTACTSALYAPTETISIHMLPVDAAATNYVSEMATTDKINILSGDHTTNPYATAGVAFRSLGVASLNIPNYPMRDGPRGMRNIMPGDVSTTWAVAEARAASFDINLEQSVGQLQGQEMRAATNELALAPVVNTLRHPRWARAQETYGEDPVLLGEMGAAFVRGMQQPGGSAACPKHYVLNDTDNNRMQADPNVDDQTLHENYTRPFEIVVKKGDPACIMAAYNEVNNTHCTENSHILHDILRSTDWNWGGFVVSDWSAAQAGHGALSMNAGLDLEMPVPSAFTTLSSDLAAGTLTAATLTQSATRVMNARTKLNDFDATYMASTPSFSLAGASASDSLAEKTELEGAVLLKNDGILPLGSLAATVGSGTPNVKTIAIVGPDNNLPVAPTPAQNSLAGFVSGLGDRGSSQTVPPHAVSYFQGLQARGGVTITQSADASAASGADVVIIPVSMAHEDEGEAYGGGADRQNMNLTTIHPIHWTTKPTAFIQSVAAINPNVIVLLNVGSAIIVEDWMASAKAIIQTFYPGQEGGTALAALLFGDTNFSGKLPFTVGQNESDYPQFQNSGSAAATIAYLHGYRLFEKNAKPVRYWFGYGMSYTTFSYSNLQVLCSNGTIPATGALNVQVTVTNTGKVAGDEIVELYIGYPNSTAPQRPVKELKAFTRVTLAAGASQNVQLSIPATDTAYWNVNCTNPAGTIPATGCWTVEKVAHTVLVGPSADPTKLLSATFTIQ
jgi:beta-glucosidase